MKPLTRREILRRRALGAQQRDGSMTLFAKQRAGDWAGTPQPEQSEYFTIGDMARTYGVSLRALRFYEDRGLMKPVRHGTVRLYDPRQRIRLQLILKGKKLGFTLTEIRDMLAGHTTAETSDFEQALEPEKIVSQIEHLERQRTGLDVAIAELRATHVRLAGAAGAPAG